MAKAKKTIEKKHTDRNSHNVRINVMSDGPQHLTSKDIKKGIQFAYHGLRYKIDSIGDGMLLIRDENNQLEGFVRKITKTSIICTRTYFNKVAKATILFKHTYRLK